MSMTSLTLHFVEYPGPDELKYIVDGVREYNRNVAGRERPRAVACFLRDEDGRIVGGVHGDLWGSSVHIAAMWVSESHRGKGHGSALLSAVETYAASQGHLLAYLETTSFRRVRSTKDSDIEFLANSPASPRVAQCSSFAKT